MATIDVNELLGDMLNAAKGVVGARWPEVRTFARMESKSFLQNMAEIERMKAAGEITREQAEILTRMHRRSMETVFTAIEGIGLALAEQAVNAALAVVRTAVNRAIGWALL